jgi:hypothetical protein
MEFIGLTPDDQRALLWSTGAGLATALGGGLAVIRRPEAGLLAFLLGTAIGVMATLSILELLIENALENGVSLCLLLSSEAAHPALHRRGAGHSLLRCRRSVLRAGGAVAAALRGGARERGAGRAREAGASQPAPGSRRGGGAGHWGSHDAPKSAEAGCAGGNNSRHRSAHRDCADGQPLAAGLPDGCHNDAAQPGTCITGAQERERHR